MKTQASILVVDDEPSNFDVIEMLLLDEGYHFTYARDGHEALNYLECNHPDVILLDIMMPGLDGIEVCHRIRNILNLHHIPIIIVTALSAKKDLAQSLEAGANDFISKPINRLELQARIRSMLQIKHQYDALQATLRLREDLSNMIVHDLRSPLSNIMLACTLLKLGELKDKQKYKIDQISLAGKKLQAMIDSLLIMAKLDTDKLVLNRSEVDLSAVGLSVIHDFTEIASQKGIELQSQLPEPGCSVWADVPLLRRILDNLISNAIKFSPTGGKVALHIECLAGHHARIQVSDQGPGVSPELRQHIFEKYEVGQLVKGVTQTGLGLAFCKMAIAVHNGKISVEDNNPRGAIFVIEI